MWYWLLLLLLYPASAIKQRLVEPSPLHRRDAHHNLLDVRDTHVQITGSRVALDDTVKVVANITKIRIADPVQISWVNKNAQRDDWIAFYTPPSRPVEDPLDWKYVSETQGWKSGAGSFTEMLFNMRGDYVIRYLSMDAQKKATVKASFKIAVSGHEPMQGHIAVTENPGEVIVMWNSARVEGPRVRYATSPQFTDTQTSLAASTTYTAQDLCGPRANKTGPVMFQDPGYFHSAVLKELKPGVRYYYSYGIDNATSDIQSFLAPPRPENKVSQTRFIGFGDMGVFYPPYMADGPCYGAGSVTRTLERETEKGGVDFILHFGDISYARGRGYVWDQFMTQMTRVASQVPYMVGVGNHEYDHVSGGEKDPSGAQEEGFHPDWGNYGDDGGGECGVPTMHRYIVPDTGNKVFWYSFNYGLVHVVQFSSEHDYRPGSRQFKWLDADLSSVDRTRTPWVVVTSHRPLYTSQHYLGDHEVALHMRLSLEELFYSHRVNLHLSGHYHSYESTCPVVSGDCVGPGQGTVYVVVGTGGIMQMRGRYDPYPWSRAQETDKFGFQRVTANTTHMEVEYVVAPGGGVRDHIVIPVWK